MAEEQLSFGADVSRLLDIVAHALYSNRNVFLRELISNAADACDRLRYEAITNPELTKNSGDFFVRVYRDPDTRTVTVVDNGIGMNREELIENLGTIAKSGTASLMDQISAAGDKKEKLSLIGQFGVGFYASFMVAHKVEVISRKAGDVQPWHWESDGKTGFSVRPASDNESGKLESDHGTAIVLKINDDSSEFLIDQKLKEIIQTYSDHIDIPVYIGRKDDEKADKEPANKGAAIWMRSKNDVTAEQYSEFYKHIGHGYDEPLLTCHWRAEGKIEYNALLFVPTMRPWDLYDPTRRHAVRLYVKRVFITDDCEGLMFPWLRFIRGVIDSEDLPLNISREMLQHNPVVARIRGGVAKRILSDLDKFSREDPEAFNTFWGQFGAVVKEGIYDAPDHREDIFKITRFFSTHGDGNELTSLADYVARMKDGQENIYYISGENLKTLKNSPQLEGFKAKGYEVLFFTDTIDDFWLQMAADYQSKVFKSVTKGDIDLSDSKDKAEDGKDEEKKKIVSAETEKLLGALKELLKEELEDVRISHRLTDSPVCLIASDSGVDMRMERVLRVHQQYQTETKRVMEINESHPLIKRLSGMDPASAEFTDAAWLLLDQARIIQGEPVPDPASFAKRMSAFMEKGLAA